MLPFSALCNHPQVPGRDQQLTYEDLVRLVDLIKSTSHFSEFRLKVGDIEVSLRRASGAPQAPAVEPSVTAPAPEAKKPRAAERSFAAGAHLLRAPMVGTFYRAPAPDKPPFVMVGQEVEAGSTVCIIEVMKLMNSIEAGVRGVVTEILVENAAAVEYAETLMVIEPRS